MRCDCNNGILAGVNSVKGPNGVISYFCEVGTATSIVVSTATPSITSAEDFSCALRTNVATIPGSTTITAGMRCDCNSGILAGVNSVTGANGVVSYFCEVGTATSLVVSKATPSVTFTEDFSCTFTSTTAAEASSVVTYCTCNDYQVHGAFTSTGDQGGATMMCNPREPQATPVVAEFDGPGRLPYKSGICRVNMNESAAGTIEDPPGTADNPSLPPLAVRAWTYDWAGIPLGGELRSDLKAPYYITIAPNKDMMFPYTLDITPELERARHPWFFNHRWDFKLTSEINHGEEYHWTTENDEHQPPGTLPRCAAGDWRQVDGDVVRDIQCWFRC
jgi:hypothetical protein